MKRRDCLKAVRTGATVPLVAACGSQPAAAPAPSAAAPATTSGGAINLGVIATTDMAPVVMADKNGYFKNAGLNNVTVTKEANWAAVQLGYGEVENANAAVTELASKLGTTRPRTFAMAFPGVSHNLSLRSWIAAAKIDPKSVQVVTTPPAQMIARMKVGEIDGFYVGEPWHEVAVNDDIGFTHLASQDVWQDHPEKALALNADFAKSRRLEARAVTMAVLEASKWLDVPEYRKSAAAVISESAFMSVKPELILPRFEVEAKYNRGGGLGEKTYNSAGGIAPRILAAILIIGVIGLLLDRGLDWVTKKVSYAS